jgi:DNA-binding NarL/FixJ family response regulator
LCEKWADKDWYDYGVAVDLGWLTPTGKAVAEKLQRGSSLREIAAEAALSTGGAG